MGQVGIESTYHWLHLGSIFISAFACLLIAFILFIIVYKIGTMPFRFAYVGFAVFMVAIALVQWIGLIGVTDGFSEIELAVSIFSALAGAIASITLIRTIPKMTALVKGTLAAHEHSLQLERTCEELGVIVEKGGREIRTRLQAIMTPTQDLLRATVTSSEQRRQLELIRDNVHSLLKTLDDYLERQPGEFKNF